MARQLLSWIDGFEQYTAGLNSPSIFRRWTAIFTIACALERKVWVRTSIGIMFPNLYVFLVGPPGAGKTVAASVSRDLLLGLDEHFVAPTSVTRASLIDNLKEAERKVVRPRESPPIVEFNSLALLSNELGVLLPAYENDFMNVLTDLYDCKVYTESRRSKDTRITINDPQLNLLAATTPSYLNNLLPQGAWDQGFLSRTIMVYAGAPAPFDLFSVTAIDDKLHGALGADLNAISALYGKLEFDPDSVAAIRDWHLSEGRPKPDHPKLQYYNTRRTSHLIKLCCVACVARTDDPWITVDDYVEALGWLTEAEAFMPDIFKAMTSGGDSQVIAECWHFAYKLHIKSGGVVSAQNLVRFLQERTPAHNIQRILETMEQAGILTKSLESFGTGYLPKPLS